MMKSNYSYMVLKSYQATHDLGNLSINVVGLFQFAKSILSQVKKLSKKPNIYIYIYIYIYIIYNITYMVYIIDNIYK